MYFIRQRVGVPFPPLKLELAGSQAMSPAAAMTVPPEPGGGVGDGLVVGIGLGLIEGRGVGPDSKVTVSCGLFEDSRLARFVAVELVEVSAKLTGSLLETSEVTFHSTHVPALIGPEEDVTPSVPGMLRYVSVVSPQELLVTPRASIPVALELFAKTRSRAWEIEPLNPSGSNRIKLRRSGEASVRIDVEVPKLRSGSAPLA
ncbi:MAG TPA: hypothetical protein VFH75_07770 [Actinomycetota bacterium]|nr:hypothetical protein [Actinomycetota bacterium]